MDFLYRGPINQLDISSNYVFKMNYATNPSQYLLTFTHSTDGNFAVGNSGEVNGGVTTNSWLYNITNQTYTTISYPGSATTTTYGIVKNSNGTYTITGGYSVDPNSIYLESGFIADIDATGTTFTNWSSLKLSMVFTHFEGISVTSDPNVYNLAADSINSSNIQLGFAVSVSRVDNKFIEISNVKIDYGASILTAGITTCNSIQNNNVVGLFSNGGIAFQATINSWY
jgi:hypothetical protein